MAIRKSTFAIDVAKFGEKAVRNTRLLVRRVALDVFGRVILKTPVGNPSLWKSLSAPPGYVGGRLRGNWQTSVGAPAEGELDRLQAEAVGAAQLEGQIIAGAWNGEGSIFLTNNLPYAEEVERGHSSQAPTGMVRVTLAEYPGIVERQVRRVRK
jgi:hypothetical protein